MVPRDTSPEVYARQLDALRRLTGEERLRRAMAMSDEVRAVLLAGIRDRRPDATETEIQEAFEDTVLGVDVAGARRRRLSAR